MYYIYFIRSERNGKVYVGVTSKDPKLRAKEHNSGSNTWSRHNRPFALKYFEKYYCEKDVKEREKFYKSGFGKQIKYIILDVLDTRKINLSGSSSVSAKG